jgi:hypothetical protein
VEEVDPNLLVVSGMLVKVVKVELVTSALQKELMHTT